MATNRKAYLIAYAHYLAATVSFWCFWQANAEYRVQPFTDEQWTQLGWTALIIAAVSWWRGRSARA